MVRPEIRFRAVCLTFVPWLAFGAASAFAQSVISPEEFLGHQVGEDYRLARWEKIVEYFQHVGENSDRVNFREIGRSTEDNPMILAEISAPETVADLAPHKSDQHKIADPRLIEDHEEERRLKEETKIVFYINCNLHSNEIASSQMAMELLYELATLDTPRIRQILENTIILLNPSANPDGQIMVVDWYERSLGEPWEGTGMPWLYQKYAGHDDNRDWFMLNLDESKVGAEVIYKEWLPTVVYDVHQMGNRGARLFVPPFHDPKNPNVPAVIDETLMIIGGHMAEELERSGKPGVISGAIYDNWWAGGFRTTVYRHNMIGILTESASVNIASPVFQRLGELRGGSRGMPNYEIATNHPHPWPGGWWRLRDIVEYQKIALMSLFTLGARYHDMFQTNYLELGKQALENAKTHPPYAWLVPPDQRDPGSAAEMLSILDSLAVEVHRADAPFSADGVDYPAGTFIMYCTQPYVNHLNDMMERQVYPNRVLYPGGPAESPYDMAGWTMPLQMGVRHVEVTRPFEAEATLLDEIPMPVPTVEAALDDAYYLLPAQANDDYRLANRLAKAGIPLWIYSAAGDIQLENGSPLAPGSLLVRNTEEVQAAGGELLEGLGLKVLGISDMDDALRDASFVEAPPARTALYQPWTASMDEGWTRFALDKFEFDYTNLHNAEIRAGGLRERYDCIILPSLSPGQILEGRPEGYTAPEYVGGIGEKGVVALQDFVSAGGTLVCIDDSSNLAIDHFNIPVRSVVRGLPTADFYCPGSVLRVWLDTTHPIGYGKPEWISGYFRRSQAFEIGDFPAAIVAEGEAGGSSAGNVTSSRTSLDRFDARVVARYSDTVLLESGWIRGAELITDKPAIVEVDYGAGKIQLFGFRIQNRGQPHGTYRLLFNAIQSSTLGEAPEQIGEEDEAGEE